MGKTSNKFIAVLAISNMLAFAVIFTLLWMLWTNNATRKNVTVNYSPADLLAIQPAAGPQRQPLTTSALPSVNARDKSIISAIAKEVKSNIENEGRIEKTTIENGNVSKDRTPGTLSDAEYVAMYNELASQKQTEKKAFSEKEVSSVQAAGKPGNKGAPTTDHFNKVDVSRLKDKQVDQPTLAQQVAAVASGGMRAGKIKAGKSSAWKDYLASLKEAEAERQNEMRTITVRNGDTLWKISERAYGTGFKYQKIFTANPHLSSPDSITVGETLRVPL